MTPLLSLQGTPAAWKPTKSGDNRYRGGTDYDIYEEMMTTPSANWKPSMEEVENDNGKATPAGWKPTPKDGDNQGGGTPAAWHMTTYSTGKKCL